MEMRKRVIITIVDGLHYRYLIDSGVFAALHNSGLEVLFLTIPSLKNRLQQDTEQLSGIEVTLLEDVSMDFFKRLYLFLINHSNRRLSKTLNIKSEVAKQQSWVKYVIAKLFSLFAKTPFYKILLGIASKAFSSRYYNAILRDFNPDLVVSSTPGQKILDLPILYEASKAKVKTISPVYSWDNLTAKGPFIFNVNYLIVWNEIMRQEAIFYHGYNASSIFVTGVSVFDQYLKVLQEGVEEKQNFFRELNLDLTKPLITITTIPRIFFGDGHAILAKKIFEFIVKGLIPPCNILLRPHPKDPTNYSKLQEMPGVVVDTYGSTPDETLVNWVPQDDNIIYLGRTMRYSDVVLNVASTITIDAACFDTPVINVCYDMKNNDDDYAGSVARYYGYTHYEHVVQCKAARMVYDDDSLLKALKLYLSDRKLDSENRKLLVNQQTGVLDGKAHKRVADCIINVIG